MPCFGQLSKIAHACSYGMQCAFIVINSRVEVIPTSQGPNLPLHGEAQLPHLAGQNK